MKTRTPPIKNSIHRSPVLRAFLLIAVVLASFALLQTTHAVSPAPDGAYPNDNTAEGDFALYLLTTGFGNTAIGADALLNNTTGSDNTAIGDQALYNNTAGSHNTANGVKALYSNTTVIDNTATEATALYTTTDHNNAANVDQP